jgi:hypothetical protein
MRERNGAEGNSYSLTVQIAGRKVAFERSTGSAVLKCQVAGSVVILGGW